MLNLRGDVQDMHIYDKWVVRDTDGHLVESKPPYTMQSSYTKERLLAGLPFPVTSCWNGLVVLPAKPFLDGLRFRSETQLTSFLYYLLRMASPGDALL